MIAAPSKPSTAKILRDLEALPFEALNKLMPKIDALRLKKHPQVLSPREAWLIKKVQAGPPAKLRSEYQRLMEKRDAGSLSNAERKRLPALAGQFDSHHVRHLQWLMELAALRKTTVQHLVRQLDLPKL